jgi:hypothetical protein
VRGYRRELERVAANGYADFGIPSKASAGGGTPGGIQNN